MALAPLRLPPGIVRPGTRYDARGRWYDANLVRWHEGAMQPIGGWAALPTASAVVAAALSDDGGVFTDETTDANDAGADDVVLIPASPAINDAFYVGASRRFHEVEVNVGTAGTGNVVTWEYYNGSTWAALAGVTDGTSNFTVTGTSTVSFTLPSDWATTTVNAVGPYYYVRARVTTAGSTTALGTQVWIGAEDVRVGEPIRGMIGWRANDQAPWLAMGSARYLHAFSAGALHDITPSGFTVGGEDATQTGAGYGSGAYGSGPYGVVDESSTTIVEANSWQLDTFGEDLVACAYSDGDIVYYDVSAGGLAAALTNAPTGCKGVVVTPERFIVALGAGGDGRKVQWADQEQTTVWSAAATNQAGDFILSTAGQIMAGRRGRNETLIWTDVDLHTMRYIGGEFVYSFHQLGEKCGAASRHSMAVVDGRAFWMGRRGFFAYDGFVKSIPCDVGDYVFNDMNRTQISKVFADVRSTFGEVTWYYPSGASVECDRYVTFNYMANPPYWNIGELARTSGVDAGAFQYPLMADPDGNIWKHEEGTTYLVDGEAVTPYAESGPLEIAQGDRVMDATALIPDEETLGETRLYIYSAMYPTADETTHGPFTAANPTDVRITARQVRLKLEQVTPGWRFGTPRVDVQPGGFR